MEFSKAIVRPPPANFAAGLTTVDLGAPDYERALEQHRLYCAALESLGLKLIRLNADARYPDSTFIEDTALLTKKVAVLTRPGAPTRQGEVDEIARTIRRHFAELELLPEDGTLDAGDVCESGNHFFIGISARTNEAGASQLSRILKHHGYAATPVDIRQERDILHLKSGIAALSGNVLVVTASLSNRRQFYQHDLLIVPAGEEYAANCIEVNGTVLLPAGFPGTKNAIETRGYRTLTLDMSEFQKMDGGLSCLSLRF
jgi:dimethylargininase